MTIRELFDLTGRVAVVTGGARHLGLEMAEGLAEVGADVIVTSRDAARASAAADKLRSAWGRDALGVALDVTDADAVERLAQQARDWKGRVDILVNNAGGSADVPGPAHLFERSVQAMRRLIEVNLLGTLYGCQAFARLMAERKSGAIINIASIAGLVGRDRRMYERHGLRGQPVDYAAAKAGVIGLTTDLAGLLGPMGIRVNAISPGGFERPDMDRGFVRDYSDRTALGRMGRDGLDLKGAAVFLACPASGYVTGHNLVVDGGFGLWH